MEVLVVRGRETHAQQCLDVRSAQVSDCAGLGDSAQVS